MVLGGLMTLTTYRLKAVSHGGLTESPVEQPLAQFAFQPPDLGDERRTSRRIWLPRQARGELRRGSPGHAKLAAARSAAIQHLPLGYQSG